MHKKLFATNKGLKLSNIGQPEISQNDVLIGVCSSFFSPGTERASLANIQKTNFQKALKFRRQIVDLVKAGDIKTLLKKAKAQSNVSAATGYSVFGKVIAVGSGVDNVKEGQYVVGVGPNANHGGIAIVPKGLVIPVDYNNDYSAVALVSIALNAIEVANFKAFSRICVLGGGLLGQLIVQLASKAGFTVDVMDIDQTAEKASLENGANRFVTNEAFGIASEIYDGFVSTVPASDTALWENIANSAKDYAKVVLVGAADLNVPRQLFYNKKLSFHTAYSYGVGRGDHDFEVLNLRARQYTGVASTLDYLIEKSVELIRKGIINFESAKKFDLTSDTVTDNFDTPDARSGIFFIWHNKEQAMPVLENKALARPEKAIERLEVDVVGHSAYFRDSHKPSLAKFNIPIKNIMNRTPKEMKQTNTKERGNALLISTPHDEHWPSIEKFEGYNYYFVDKPLLIKNDEFQKYLNEQKNVVALMNRRYSDYTKLVQNFVSQFDDSLVKIEFNFCVPHKSQGDPIFRQGGRIIGEMCHHIDLAIYLNGEVREVNSINFDDYKEKWQNERHMLLVKHKNERISIIKYWPETSPFFNKEAIIATACDQYLFVKDFAKYETNAKIKNQNILEKDKGCSAMWGELKNSIENNPQDIAHMQNIDYQVYQILSEVSL